MINDRKKKLLQAILMEFIANAEPVGSRTLTKRYDLGLSPATIRNEMSDLEEMGFLLRPHTSAGRVPTEKAYRYYVDQMMKTHELTNDEKAIIAGKINNTMNELDKTIKHATKLLSELTNLTSFAVTPKKESDRLQHIELLQIEGNRLVLVLVAETGKTSTVVMHSHSRYSEDALVILERALSIEYKGKTITESLTMDIADTIKNDAPAVAKLFSEISPSLASTLRGMLETDIYMEGISNIFANPEYSDNVKASKFIDMIFKKDDFTRVLSNRDDGIIITIGEENEDDALKNSTLITATYHVDGEYIGKIGVIGPTRMPYGHVTSVIKYLTENVDKSFNKDLKPE